MTGRRTVGLAVSLLLSIFAIKPAQADSIISLASVGTASDSGQSNSSGATIVIAPNAGWAISLPGSAWVSFGSTGDTSAVGFVATPNGTIVSFFDVFNIPATATGGSLTVMADDSATVLLNGVSLMSEATSTGNTYGTCSDFGIGCVFPTTINLPASLFHSGLNTLEFQVAQRAGYSFGLDYSGSVIDPVTIPEPGSGLLLGLGLLTLSVAVCRQMQLRI
jgi:PEP-CTERM motif